MWKSLAGAVLLLGLLAVLVSAPGPALAVEEPYYVQVSTFKKLEQAETHAASFRAKSLDAFAHSVETSRGEVVYAVYVGPGGSKQEAKALALKLMADGTISDYYIRRPPSSEQSPELIQASGQAVNGQRGFRRGAIAVVPSGEAGEPTAAERSGHRPLKIKNQTHGHYTAPTRPEPDDRADFVKSDMAASAAASGSRTGVPRKIYVGQAEPDLGTDEPDTSSLPQMRMGSMNLAPFLTSNQVANRQGMSNARDVNYGGRRQETSLGVNLFKPF